MYVCSGCFCVVFFSSTSVSPLFSGLALAIRDQEYHGFLFANVSHDRGQLVDVAAVEMLCLPQVQDHRGWARFGCKETHVSAERRTQEYQWGNKETFLLNQTICSHQDRQSLIFSLPTQSQENLFTHCFIVRLPLVTLSMSSFIVLYCYILMCCVGALSKKMMKGIKNTVELFNLPSNTESQAIFIWGLTA